MEVTSASLLLQATAVFQSGRQRWRDARLEVGGLLHEYILARLREGEALSDRQRHRMEATRTAAVRDAAVALGSNRSSINSLVRTAEAVRLLGAGDAGGLSYAAIRCFQAVIERETDAKGKGAVSRFIGDGGLSPASRETWRFRAGLESVARAVWQRALAGELTAPQVREELGALIPVRKAVPTHRETAALAAPRLEDLARVAGPRDLADMILSLIRSNEDAGTVAELLAPQLQRLKQRSFAGV